MLFWRKRKKRAQVNTPKVVLIKQAVIGVIIVGTITLIGTGVWHLTRIDELTITSVTVEGGETISYDVITRIVEEKLSGTYFKLVPHRFAWTYPKKVITAALQEENRIKNVQVIRTSGTELHITFSEYHPISLWCTAADTTDCFFLDETGYVFAKAPQLSGIAFIRYSDQNRQPEIGIHAYDAETQTELLQFTYILKNRFGFWVSHIEQSGVEEIVYYISGGGALKMTQRIPLEETLQNLETILTSAQFEHLEPGNFQYIDLRYGDKIFVNEEVPDDTAITTVSNNTDEGIEEDTEVTITSDTNAEETTDEETEISLTSATSTDEDIE